MFQLCPRIVPEILGVLIFCADGGGPGDKIVKVRPRLATGAHRVLTIEVWHQTSGGKGMNILREVLMASAMEDSLRCSVKCVTLVRIIGIGRTDSREKNGLNSHLSASFLTE